jgi:glycosyltransferase involved in cell wall biosynthesis
MARNEDVAVLIPALDCARTIGAVVNEARHFARTLLVVDDGSADATADVAAREGAELIRHTQNLGKGAALRTGMEALAERGVTRVVTMDGDGQHFASDIPVLLAESERNPRAIVIGARRMEGVEASPVRRFGNRFADRWVEIACGRSLPDTQSGFRVYPVTETMALGTRASRFGFETEVLIRAVRAGLDVRSVPVRVHYPPAGERTSHFRPFVDTVRIIFVVLGLILRIW